MLSAYERIHGHDGSRLSGRLRHVQYVVPPSVSKATMRRGKEDMNNIDDFPWTIDRCSERQSIYYVIQASCEKIAGR